MEVQTGLLWLRIEYVGKHGNEHSGSINCGEFLDKLKTG